MLKDHTAASAASPVTKVRGVPPVCRPCRAIVRGLPCILVALTATLLIPLLHWDALDNPQKYENDHHMSIDLSSLLQESVPRRDIEFHVPNAPFGCVFNCCLRFVLFSALLSQFFIRKSNSKDLWGAARAAKFGSRCLKTNRVIKSAASTAAPMTKMQRSSRKVARCARGASGGSPAFWLSERLH